jgi:pre-mRNA-splicing factor RBM22/SLT11
MLDLSFGLPIVVRDAALKMIAPGPQSAVNREFYAQNHERELEEGKGAVEEYEKTDEKARELLRRLANSEPYFKKARRITAPEGEDSSSSTALTTSSTGQLSQPGPIRTRDSRGGSAPRGSTRGGRGGARRPFPSAASLPPTAADIAPPSDPTIMSLFITGIEDDLPEFAIRDFFSAFGKLRSLVCSHMSHCAFVNYSTREAAEAAAEKCQGRAVIRGCPLRVQWGRPKPIGTMERDERGELARDGRSAFVAQNRQEQAAVEAPQRRQRDELAAMTAVAPPPGQDEVNYASLAGN